MLHLHIRSKTAATKNFRFVRFQLLNKTISTTFWYSYWFLLLPPMLIACPYVPTNEKKRKRKENSSCIYFSTKKHLPCKKNSVMIIHIAATKLNQSQNPRFFLVIFKRLYAYTNPLNSFFFIYIMSVCFMPVSWFVLLFLFFRSSLLLSAFYWFLVQMFTKYSLPFLLVRAFFPTTLCIVSKWDYLWHVFSGSRVFDKIYICIYIYCIFFAYYLQFSFTSVLSFQFSLYLCLSLLPLLQFLCAFIVLRVFICQF